jgi:general secretion pathway protein J
MTRAPASTNLRRLQQRRVLLAGFTLLELLVAISILATVSIIAWRGLDTLVHTRSRLEPEGQQVRALLTAFGQLDRDVAQTINPTLFAFTVSPVAVTTFGGQPALSIMRLAPVEEDKPSALQVIGYRVEDGFLVRSSSLPMRGRGAVAAEEVTNVRILDSVKSLRLRIWRDGLGWVDPLASDTTTPPAAPGTIPGTTAPLVPPGIEVTVERNDGKVFRKVLLVG